MAALVHTHHTPFGTVASATAIRRAMGAGVLHGSFPLPQLGTGAWNGESRALDVRRMR